MSDLIKLIDELEELEEMIKSDIEVTADHEIKCILKNVTVDLDEIISKYK